jgi:molybdate transport system ATP-binding protein
VVVEIMSLHADFVLGRSNDFVLDLALDIPSGTTTALLGPNGAGKSTTVEILAGLHGVDSGFLQISGRKVDSPGENIFVPPSDRRVGVVFQDFLLFDHLSVLDNVAFAPRSAGASTSESRAISRRTLAGLGFEDLLDRRPPDLSGGQAQGVALARALAMSPELLLLDEPLSALDVEVRTRLRTTLASHLQTYDGPRLLITHDPTDAFLLADNIVVIEAGKVTQTGAPDVIRRHPATPYIAALSGRNLLQGDNRNGMITIEGSSQALQTANTSTVGPVLVAIAPSAIALHSTQPHGSPRNTWQTVVAAIEPLGDTSRVYLADPLALSADLTPAAVAALDLGPGSAVWASIKATEIDVTTA